MFFITKKSLVKQKKSLNLNLDTSKSKFLKSNESSDSQKSVWKIFLLGLFGGVLALLTPCVFPMIPLTVSYFIKNDKSRTRGVADSFIYVFFYNSNIFSFKSAISFI